MVYGALPEAGIFPAATLPADTGASGPDGTQHYTPQPVSLPLPVPTPAACDGVNNPQRTTHPSTDPGELRMARTPDRTRERNILCDIPALSAPQESMENCTRPAHHRRTIRFGTDRHPPL